MNESPDRNMEGAPKMECRECRGNGYRVIFDEKGKPVGKKTCAPCSGTGKAP